MTIESLLAQIDGEIINLEKAKALLTGSGSAALKKERARETKEKVYTRSLRQQQKRGKKRKLTPEGNSARIAEAVRRRWSYSEESRKSRRPEGIG